MSLSALILSTICLGAQAAPPAAPAGAVPASKKIVSLQSAADYAAEHVEIYQNLTVFCGCEIVRPIVNIKACGYNIQKSRDNALKLELVQIVPSETFGREFPEWTGKSVKCLKTQTKGIDCARTNSEFVKMESDLYNIFPESAEINELRGTKPIDIVTGNKIDFGGCKIKISESSFEPADSSKGVVARAYLNFQHRYPGHLKIAKKLMRLYKNWDKANPVSEAECHRMKALEELTGYKNLYFRRCDPKTLKSLNSH